MRPRDALAKPMAVGNGQGTMERDEARVAERKEYLEFGPADRQRLRELHRHLPRNAQGFGDDFYRMLREHPKLGALLDEPGTTERLQSAHVRYFSELTAGDYGSAYVERRLEVGRTHARIGLAPEWYIGAFRRYLSGMLETVWDTYGGRREDVTATFDALLKVVMFDLGLTLDTYFLADKQQIALRDRAIESSMNGIFIADASLPDYPLIYVNPAFEGVVGAQGHCVLGQPCLCRDHSADRSAIRDAMAKGLHANTVLRFDQADGRPRWVELFLAPVRNERDAITHFVGVLNDVTHRKNTESQLHFLATHDTLTGLANRHLFHLRSACPMAACSVRKRLCGGTIQGAA